MNSIFRIISATLLIMTVGSPALAALRMVKWNALPTAPFLLFVSKDETPAQAAQKYLNAFFADPEMAILLKGQNVDLSPEKFENLSNDEIQRSALLIANKVSDLTNPSPRVSTFRRLFEKSGTLTLVLPLRADLGLNKTERKEMRELIAAKMPLLVAMGGEDVEPSLYRQQKTMARNTLPQRDYAESAIIRTFLKAEKGFLLSICRGHQLSSATLGYQLIQDIPSMIDSPSEHSNHTHSVHLRQTTHSRLMKLFPEGKIQVNSLHHQSVRYQTGGPLEIAAISEDGIVEALEMKNGHGLFLQFHPELMDDHVGASIMKQVPLWKSEFAQRACGRVHN